MPKPIRAAKAAPARASPTPSSSITRPPIIGDLKSTKTASGARIDAKIVDRTGCVANAEYAIDSKDDWQAISASDKMFDSPEEAISFTVDGLSIGAHQIMLRATDDHGNQAFETVQVTVEKP